MIAVLLKSAKKESAISPLFGKAKAYALVDQAGNIELVENQSNGGVNLINSLVEKGVKEIILQHIGDRPLEFALSNEIKIFFAGEDRIVLEDALKAHKEGKLLEINASNKDALIEHAHDHSGGGCCSSDNHKPKGFGILSGGFTAHRGGGCCS